MIPGKRTRSGLRDVQVRRNVELRLAFENELLDAVCVPLDRPGLFHIQRRFFELPADELPYVSCYERSAVCDILTAFQSGQCTLFDARVQR